MSSDIVDNAQKEAPAANAQLRLRNPAAQSIMPKQALLVYNPAARTTANPEVWLRRIMHGLCEQGNYEVTVHPTDPRQTSQHLASIVKRPVDLVVAAGGDGTVGKVLSALARSGSRAPAAIAPLGTINVLARKLGILDGKPFGDPLDNVMSTILHGRRMRIDLGIMNNEYFAVTAGAGPLSDLFLLPTRDEKTNLKILAYWKAMLKIVGAPPVVFQITTDVSLFQVSASGVFVSNVDDLGLGNSDHNVAELADGLLTVYVVNPLNFGDYVSLGFQFGGGVATGSRPYFVRKVRQVKIDVVPERGPLSPFQRARLKVQARLAGHSLALPPRQRKVSAMLDGEPYGTTPLDIAVSPNAVTVLVPPTIEVVGAGYGLTGASAETKVVD